MNKATQSSLRLSIQLSLFASLTMILGIVMSFMAEPFEQEHGIGKTILGYNRDWLVDCRWWFVAGLVLCLVMASYSWRKLD